MLPEPDKLPPSASCSPRSAWFTAVVANGPLWLTAVLDGFGSDMAEDKSISSVVEVQQPMELKIPMACVEVKAQIS